MIKKVAFALLFASALCQDGDEPQEGGEFVDPEYDYEVSENEVRSLFNNYDRNRD